MASISVNRKTGHKRIIFTNEAGERKALYMGEADKRQMQAVKGHIENILQSLATKSILDGLTARWLTTLDPGMKEKLAAVGLIESPGASKLGTLLDTYIAERRIDSKPNTIRNMEAASKWIQAFYGPSRNLQTIGLKDADALRLEWIGKKWGDNTIRRRLGFARQFFNEAIRRKLITENPFADAETTTRETPERSFFITAEMSRKILAACPNPQWKAIFGLVRWGGLRCPSELQPLRWEHINWDAGRILVTSPKTEHHAGKGSRVIPLFPELESILLEARDDAPDGTTHVLWRYRLKNANLRTGMHKIIWEAGYKPWEKLFINLRSTRETELADKHPLHVVCAWMGNSKAIAKKHYLQVTDEHFDSATRAPEGATRNKTRASAAPSSTTEQTDTQEIGATADGSSGCASVHDGAALTDLGGYARDRNRTSENPTVKDAAPETRDAQNDAREN
jgi:integrase